MRKFAKHINGATEIKLRNEIVVVKDGMQYINPSDDILICDGWVEYVEPTPTGEEEEAARKQAEIRHMKDMLAESDYKVIKCMEAYLCGEELPYDIAELHAERDEHRRRINDNEL